MSTIGIHKEIWEIKKKTWLPDLPGLPVHYGDVWPSLVSTGNGRRTCRSVLFRRSLQALVDDSREAVALLEHAISYQTANRRHTSVEKNGRASRRMEKFLANLPHLSVIGDFHSHTGWGDLKGVGNLSTQDLVDMIPGNLYLIIVANDKRRHSAWQYNGDGTLSGTADDYHFRIGGYYLDDYMRVKRANIFCPYAIGFSAKES